MSHVAQPVRTAAALKLLMTVAQLSTDRLVSTPTEALGVLSWSDCSGEVNKVFHVLSGDKRKVPVKRLKSEFWRSLEVEGQSWIEKQEDFDTKASTILGESI